MGRKKSYTQKEAENSYDNRKKNSNDSVEQNKKQNQIKHNVKTKNNLDINVNWKEEVQLKEEAAIGSIEQSGPDKNQNNIDLKNNRAPSDIENGNKYNNKDSEQRNSEGNLNHNLNKKEEKDLEAENNNDSRKPSYEELGSNFNKTEEIKLNQEPNKLIIKAENENKEEAFMNRKRSCSSGIIDSEFFKGIHSKNSNKFLKQILKMQNRADKYVEKLYINSNNFQEIKKELHNKKCDNIFNAVSSIIGFNWRINLKRTNFFILAAEAWIIEVFWALELYVKSNLENEKDAKKNENEELKEDELHDQFLKDYPVNFTFSAILKKIANMKIDEKNYLFNLSVLTGSIYSQSYSSATTKLIENNIGKLFFNSVKIIINEFKFSEAHEDEELDQRKFENLLVEILRKAVEKALNSMDSQASELKSSSSYINYLQCWEKLKEEAKNSLKKFTYKNFMQILEKENFKLNKRSEVSVKADTKETMFDLGFEDNSGDSAAISRDFSIKICAETFFDFCSYKFPQIIEDILSFIREYDSLLFRLKNLFGQTINKFVDYNKKYINFFKAIYNGIMNKLKTKVKRTSDSIDRLYEYYHKKFPKAFEVVNHQKQNIAWSYNLCKNWLNSSTSLIKNSSSHILENYFYEKYKFLYDSLVNPIYNLSYAITNNVTKLIVFQISKCSGCLISYKNIMMRLVTFTRKIIQQAIISYYESTIGILGIGDKIKFLQETNNKNLIKFEESEDKQYLIVKVNCKIIGNLLLKFKSLRLDLIRLTFETYKSVFRKAFQIPQNLISFSNAKGVEVLNFLKLKFEEIVEAE